MIVVLGEVESDCAAMLAPPSMNEHQYRRPVCTDCADTAPTAVAAKRSVSPLDLDDIEVVSARETAYPKVQIACPVY